MSLGCGRNIHGGVVGRWDGCGWHGFGVSAGSRPVVDLGGYGAAGPVTTGPASASELDSPADVAVDASGNVYIADGINAEVEKVTPSGTLSVIAGTGTSGTPAAGPATSTPLDYPAGVAVDSAGNVYIADLSGSVVEKVTPSGMMTIVAGSGGQGAPTPGPATSSALYGPDGVAVDGAGNLYIAASDNNEILKVTPSGTLSVFAGTGQQGGPTAGPATHSMLANPSGVAVDAAGDVYIADLANNRIEMVSPDGVLSFVAGNGQQGTPTPGPALSSDLNFPRGSRWTPPATSTSPNTSVTVSMKCPPRAPSRLSPAPAPAGRRRRDRARVPSSTPYGVAVDSAGDVFIADNDNNEVEEVTAATSAPVFAADTRQPARWRCLTPTPLLRPASRRRPLPSPPAHYPPG